VTPIIFKCIRHVEKQDIPSEFQELQRDIVDAIKKKAGSNRAKVPIFGEKVDSCIFKRFDDSQLKKFCENGEGMAKMAQCFTSTSLPSGRKESDNARHGGKRKPYYAPSKIWEFEEGEEGWEENDDD
ncbi:unnamed protein product, partial [Ixodes hexagonus]